MGPFAGLVVDGGGAAKIAELVVHFRHSLAHLPNASQLLLQEGAMCHRFDS
jgi:hypothetical protein